MAGEAWRYVMGPGEAWWCFMVASCALWAEALHLPEAVSHFPEGLTPIQLCRVVGEPVVLNHSSSRSHLWAQRSCPSHVHGDFTLTYILRAVVVALGLAPSLAGCAEKLHKLHAGRNSAWSVSIMSNS